ncbi:MAG: single-stranded DNA-binding protein [Saprospiraceae bacterium]
MLNKVLLIGNLGKDPDIRTSESGVSRANFTLATNENYKDRNGDWQKSTEWHDVVLWRGLADRSKTLRKGMLVYIEGKLTHRKWVDKEGKEHYSAEVTVDMLKILEKRESSNPHDPTTQPGDVKDNLPGTQGFSSHVDEDDLPF